MKLQDIQIANIDSQANISLFLHCFEIVKKLLYFFLVWHTLVGIISGILFIIANNMIVDDLSTNLDSFKTYGISYLCISIAVAIMEVGLSVSQSKTFRILFFIMNLIFIMLFIVLIIYYKLKINSYTNELNDICQNVNSSGLMQLVENSYSQNVTDIYCSEKCMCKADISMFPSQKYNKYKFSNNGKSNVMDCPNLIYVSDCPPIPKLIDFLRLIETSYNCSGICNTFNFYSFSDVARGIPEKECGQEILKHFNKYIIGLYVISSINIANFIILSCIAIAYIKIFVRTKRNISHLSTNMNNSDSIITNSKS